MSAALLGLLAVQWYWVDSALQLKEKEFDLQVANALDRVAERLQDTELMIAVNAEVKGQLIVEQERIARWDGKSERVTTSNILIRKIDADGDSAAPRPSARSANTYSYAYRSSGDTLHLTTQQQGNGATMIVQGDGETVVTHEIHGPPDTSAHQYAMSVVKRMLRAPKPITERVRPGRLDSLLHEELQQRGIADAFAYRLDSLALGAQAPVHVAGEGAYPVLLFPHDLPPSRDYLVLTFPGRAGGWMRALGLMLPTSILLAVVLVACFVAALVLLGRQRRLAASQRDFIHNMTHELKTPIATISLAVQALDDPDMRAAGRTEAYLGIIRTENARMQDQVARVLEAASSARGEVALEMAPVDLGPLVAEEVARMQLLLDARGGKLDLLGGGEGYWVQGDRVHLGSILRNLLDNAEKYSPDAPQLTVRLQQQAGQVVLAVQDRGIGMSSAVQKRVFEPFFRAPTGNVHDVKGFGLGLSYVKDMVEAHHGQITVQSAPGKGTTFTLTFPAAQPS
jgi:two-component system phosphate regulon sensor histidine kinase PhoR